MTSDEDNAMLPEMVNPTGAIDLDFRTYVDERERDFAERSRNGVPNYAFSLDRELRRKLAAVRPLRDLAQAVTSLSVPLQKNAYMLKGVAVSPTQLPDIYQAGEDCARALGIGVPQIFVYHDPSFEAFTIATDDIEPIIVISSALADALSPAELRFVIGHECGHIHNLHGVYNTAAVMIANPLLHSMFEQLKSTSALRIIQSLGQLQLFYNALQGALHMFFMHWSRCAEITSDRAGLICCGDLSAAQHALARLVVGDVKYEGFNIDEFVQQLNKTSRLLRVYDELASTHPLIPRRIAALSHFAECDVLFAWRPELQSGAASRSIEQVDQACAESINVFSKGAVKP